MLLLTSWPFHIRRGQHYIIGRDVNDESTDRAANTFPKRAWYFVFCSNKTRAGSIFAALMKLCCGEGSVD